MNNRINSNDLLSFDFLNCICKNVYLELDYKDYHSKIWILYL